MVTISHMENNQVNETAQFDLSGLSTDTKPTEINGFPIGTNSLFLELDTGDFYYYTGSTWSKVGA